MTSKLNLQLFADGGASAGASSSTTATPGANNGASVGEQNSNPTPTGKDNAKLKVVYGKQENIKTSENDVSTQQNQRLSFEDLVKSEDYAEEAKAYMNKHFSKRLSKYKGYESENAKMREILDMQNVRYGLDPTSETYLEDYAEKVQSDTKLYEDEAMEMGVPVEEYIKIKNAERIIEQNKRETENRQRESVIQNHLQNIIGQAEELKADFPTFDIEKELSNPHFKRMVDPPELGGSGISVRDAYFAIHNREIMQATVNNAVNQAQIRTANAVATNKSRPTENGLSKNSTVVVKDDPSKLKLEDFKKIRETYRQTGYGPKF